MNLELFVARLRQVTAWTERLAAGFDFERGDYGAVFRQTNPLIDGQPLYAFERGGYDYGPSYTTWRADDYNPDVYQQALAAALAARPAPPAVLAGAGLLDRGRILGFETQLTTHDGVAIADSRCFVDESDVPPSTPGFT